MTHQVGHAPHAMASSSTLGVPSASDVSTSRSAAV
jgi:hypothetical protein